MLATILYVQSLGLGEAVNKSGKVEDAVLDVAGVEKITPLIVTACEKDKKASFVQKLKEEWAKVKKDV
ncbi:HdeA/HdeB family chaperone [Pseudomonas lundensis]|uniref:HdeA/HdeB family chaperone n=1 Tax=Pseudomonas lundensis TaxID=86185 RepID=UPI003BA05A59